MSVNGLFRGLLAFVLASLGAIVTLIAQPAPASADGLTCTWPKDLPFQATPQGSGDQIFFPDGTPEGKPTVDLMGISIKMWNDGPWGSPGDDDDWTWFVADRSQKGDVIFIDAARVDIKKNGFKWISTDVAARTGGWDWCPGETSSAGGWIHTPAVKNQNRPVRVCLKRGSELQCGNWWWADNSWNKKVATNMTQWNSGPDPRPAPIVNPGGGATEPAECSSRGQWVTTPKGNGFESKVCGNNSGSALRERPAAGAQTVNTLNTSTSWFACYVRGEQHAGGNDIWYYTLGDNNGSWGYIPAANVRSAAHPFTGVSPCTEQPPLTCASYDNGTTRSSLSGDARAELIGVNTANDTEGIIRAWRNDNGFSAWPWGPEAPRIASGFTDPCTVRFADLDGDGKKELIGINTRADGKIRAWHNDHGWSSFAWGREEPSIGTGWYDPAHTHFADINGDGRDELIGVNNEGDGEINLWWNVNGFAPWPWKKEDAPIATGFEDTTRVRFADLDGDLKADLINVNNNGSISAWRNTGGGPGSMWSGPVEIGSGWGDPAAVRFGDLDGDGMAELVGVNTNGTGKVRAWKNNGQFPSAFPWGQEMPEISNGWDSGAKMRRMTLS